MATKKLVKSKANIEQLGVDEMAMMLLAVTKEGNRQKIRIVTCGHGKLVDYLTRFAKQLEQDPNFDFS